MRHDVIVLQIGRLEESVLLSGDVRPWRIEGVAPRNGFDRVLGQNGHFTKAAMIAVPRHDGPFVDNAQHPGARSFCGRELRWIEC